MSDESPIIETPESQAVPQSAAARLPIPTQAQLDARRAYRRALRRSRNPFRLSFRSLMMTCIFATVAMIGIMATLVALRGETGTPALEPVIEVIAAPVNLAGDDDPDQADLPSSLTGAAEQTILAAATPANPVLTGPPIPTVVITSTPIPLTVGARVAVYDVGNDKLNVRNIPSLTDSQVLFRAEAGALFDIVGGPQEADGFTWWRLRDPRFSVEGWAVAIYLQTIPEDPG